MCQGGLMWAKPAINQALVIIACGFLSSCSVLQPRPILPDEWYQQAQCEIHEMFARQPPFTREIDFCEALARGFQFNLDHRTKLANAAIHAGQMELAEFAMLPELEASGSVYNRNNDNASFASGPDGRPTDLIINGSDRTIRSWRLGAKWNLLDLGRGYIKAREEGEKLLIAEEEARKELQKLVQNIKVAYWRAYNAQQLQGELNTLQCSLTETKNQIALALTDKVIPKDALLDYQTALLDGNRRIAQLEERLKRSEFEFKYLINLPPNQCIKLKKPPGFISKIQNLKNLDFEKLDAITLVNRPELRGQNYQRRIANLGTKAAILQALPSITFNGGRNFNSNSFLVNNFWSDSSIEVSWNIINLASLPVALKTADTQIKYESLKLMTLTLGALNETRINFARYQVLAKEGMIAKKQTENAKRIYYLTHHRQQSALASKHQSLLAKVHYLFAQMDEILLLSDVSTALGDLYLSAGFDVLPIRAINAPPNEVLAIVERNLCMQENVNFKHYVNRTYEKLFSDCPCGL